MDLLPTEIRVLGCLMEKQVTTPDTYPLTLNSLRLACNQATNRDPVVDYDDAVLRDALRRLERRGYIRLASGHSSRASKYRHLLADALPLSAQEHAVLCVLMLRGPQTPGELKQRGERMHAFAGLDEVHETLEQLIARGLVRRLERRPGQKEERYEHRLSDDLAPGQERASVNGLATIAPDPGPEPSDPPAPAQSPAAEAALGRTAESVIAASASAPAVPTATSSIGALGDLEDLEGRVARLERAVEELRAALVRA